MARNSKKKKVIQEQIYQLERQKRNGMLRAVVAFAALAFCIWIKLTLQGQGVEWANSTFANLVLFVLALVAAGVAGMGTRAWQKARAQIARLEKKL